MGRRKADAPHDEVESYSPLGKGYEASVLDHQRPLRRVHHETSVQGRMEARAALPLSDDEQWNEGMELKFHGGRRVTIRAWDSLRESKRAVVFIRAMRP